LPLASPGTPNTDAIQILSIDGLGPVKGNVNTTPYGLVDGEVYFGTTIGKRNIVLTLGLNPNWSDQTMASLRKLLYAYFMPKYATKLRFISDLLPDVEISGYVESFEPNIFSKDPQVQISIICPKPEFVAVSPTVVTGTVGDGTVPTEIEYDGTLPTGFLLEVTSSPSRTSYTGPLLVVNRTPFERTFQATATVDNTKKFKLSTIPGQKSAVSVLLATGVETSVLSTVDGETTWPQIEPGTNEFSIVVPVGSVGQNWTLVFYKKFGGL
jgi:hypothetical protein